MRLSGGGAHSVTGQLRARTHKVPPGRKPPRPATLLLPVLVRAMFPQAANYSIKYPADGGRARRNASPVNRCRRLG